MEFETGTLIRCKDTGTVFVTVSMTSFDYVLVTKRGTLFEAAAARFERVAEPPQKPRKVRIRGMVNGQRVR